MLGKKVLIEDADNVVEDGVDGAALHYSKPCVVLWLPLSDTRNPMKTCKNPRYILTFADGTDKRRRTATLVFKVQYGTNRRLNCRCLVKQVPIL
jgi:hypothetical protein